MIRPTVLIVDDVDANLAALEAQLANLGCDIVRANTGNEALKQLLKREFAVVLLDVNMPEMNGYEVAGYARQNGSTQDLPIIFVTAMDESADNLLRGYGSGAVDYLFKPINAQVLRSKVQVFLDLYVSRRRLSDEIDAHKNTLAELEAFNYSVSHDLRAPLRPLDGFSQALLEDYGDKLDGEGKRLLNRIRAAAQRMSQIIDDLLGLSRVTRMEISLQTVDLSALVRSIIADLRGSEPARDVEFVAEPEAQVQADPRLLRIGVENLLRNAWKFTQKKAPARIEFRKSVEARETVYIIRDNGVGFDPTFASKLFQPFQRLHASSEFEGTGIGLAIVKRVIARHGGRIWTEAAPGQGATFFFTLEPPRQSGGFGGILR